MIYVKILTDKKMITGNKSPYFVLLGGVIKVSILPPIDNAPEYSHILPVYIANNDEDYHNLLIDANDPLVVQPVLNDPATSYKALLVHSVEAPVQLEMHEDFGVVDVISDVLPVN